MNYIHDEPIHPRDRDFDRVARTHHAEALSTLSPQVRARLRGARHAAHANAPVRRGLGWVLAGGCAAVFAMAIALQLQREPPVTAAPVQTAAIAPATDRGDTGNPEVDSMIAALEENPDLYLWLAANDDALPPPSEP